MGCCSILFIGVGKLKIGSFLCLVCPVDDSDYIRIDLCFSLTGSSFFLHVIYLVSSSIGLLA